MFLFCSPPFFSLSLVGMERELPSAFLLPGSVSLSGISGSFFFFLTDEGRKLKIESSGVWIPMFVPTQMIDELDLEYSMLTSLLSKGERMTKRLTSQRMGRTQSPASFLVHPPWWVLYSSQHEIGRYVT